MLRSCAAPARGIHWTSSWNIINHKELSSTIRIRDVRVARSENEILQPHSLRGRGSTKYVGCSLMVSNDQKAETSRVPTENDRYLRGTELTSSNRWRICVVNEPVAGNVRLTSHKSLLDGGMKVPESRVAATV